MSSYGIYQSGLAALGQSAKIDVTANNLANISTVGFRGDRVTFRARMVEALEGVPDFGYYNALVDRHGGAPFIDAIRFDRNPGGFEQTGRRLDFALRSDGFFTVRDSETGGVYYTRAGNFVLDGQGHLMTADGRYEVLDGQARGVAIDPAAEGDLRLSEEGRLFKGVTEAGALAVVDFDDYSRLRKYGDNLFANHGAAVTAPQNLRVVQGALETSSVNPIAEMVRMIQAFRVLESNLQMIQIQDRTLERTVGDFGRVQS